MGELENLLGTENVKYNEPMSKHTTFKVGGIADTYITVNSKEKLLKVLELLKNEKITIIGNGSNLLVTDKGIKGITIKPSFKIIEKEETKDEIIYRVGSGVSIIALAVKALEDSATGLEFASGIPRNYWWCNSHECRLLWWRNK